MLWIGLSYCVFPKELSMRSNRVLALVVSVLSLGFMAPTESHAFGWQRGRAPVGWGREQAVRHWVYYPRYRHTYKRHPVTDPYAYQYAPRRYYPHYNSGYWRSSAYLRSRRRARFVYPRYRKAWGYHKPGYRALTRRAYRHRHW